MKRMDMQIEIIVANYTKNHEKSRSGTTAATLNLY